MARRMRTSEAGLELIKRFEGYREHAVALGDGRHMIGYGHTKAAREGLRISRANAEAILREFDLPPVEAALSDSVFAPLSQNEFDALVSLAFNIGWQAFQCSDVFALVNSGEKLRAAEAFSAWRKAEINGRLIIIDALVRRRAAERALFLNGAQDVPEAPGAIVRPRLDAFAAASVPGENGQAVDTSDGRARLAIIEEIADPDTPLSGSEETAPEAAARAVAERFSRILGERKSEDEAAQPADTPSPEDVANAVAELAADDARRSPRRRPEPGKRPAVTTFIDDLETTEPGEAEFSQDGYARGAPWLSVILFALAAFSGALVAAWGFEHIGTLTRANDAPDTPWQVFSGPFAILFGSLIFLIMLYYLIRALADR